MKPPKSPFHRLAVRNDEVETVQPVLMVLVETARHDSVHGHCRDRHSAARKSSLGHGCDGSFIIDGTYQYSQDVMFALVYHAPSNFCVTNLQTCRVLGSCGKAHANRSLLCP